MPFPGANSILSRLCGGNSRRLGDVLWFRPGRQALPIRMGRAGSAVRRHSSVERLGAKLLQTEPKPDQARPRKRAWIFLDSFVRFGAFQSVTGGPNKKICLPRRSLVGVRRPTSLEADRLRQSAEIPAAAVSRPAGPSEDLRELSPANAVNAFSAIPRNLPQLHGASSCISTRPTTSPW